MRVYLQAMSGTAPSRFSSYWRRAGLNYLEMVTVASTSMRNCLKEPLRSDALGRTTYQFREFKFENGEELPAGEMGASRKLRST